MLRAASMSRIGLLLSLLSVSLARRMPKVRAPPPLPRHNDAPHPPLYVVIPAYTRVHSVDFTLRQLVAHSASPTNIHVFVCQSAWEPEDAAVTKMTEVLTATQGAGVFGSLRHVLTPRYGEEGVHADEGRNAVRNWNRCVSYVLGGGDSTPTPAEPLQVDGQWTPDRADVVDAVLVIEDDVRLSPDALSYFMAARARLLTNATQSWTSPVLATGATRFRPSLLVGHGDLTRTAAWDKGPTDALIDILPGVPRAILPSSAVMFPRSTWEEGGLGALFQIAGDWHGNEQRRVRAGLPLLQGCTWCVDGSPSSLIEWWAQGRTFLAPRVPRAGRFAGDPNSPMQTQESIAEGEQVPSSGFSFGVWRGRALTSFPAIGFSAGAPPVLGDGWLRVFRTPVAGGLTLVDTVVSFLAEPVVQAVLLLAWVGRRMFAPRK